MSNLPDVVHMVVGITVHAHPEWDSEYYVDSVWYERDQAVARSRSVKDKYTRVDVVPLPTNVPYERPRSL